MRQVLSLSFSPQEVKDAKNISKKRGFDSVSSYIKYLVNSDKDLISEDEILEAAEEADREYKNGTIIKANSVMDLL